MKKSIFFFSFVLILVLSLPAFAAEIEGVVTDATGAPLPGANVFVKGTTVGAATDQNGKFSFKYDPAEEFVIIVRYMGYKTKSLTLRTGDDLSNLKFEMTEDVFLADEIVVTGIASKRAKSVAEVAVARLSADQLTVVNSYQDLSQMVAGKVAGVSIAPSSGNVGGGIRFNMRSGGGLNGQEQPLIFVDGVRIDNSDVEGLWVGGQGIGTLADLNPEDVEKVEILKGPAGAASYGTSGSNGVVLITTKRGKLMPGQPKGISLDYKMVTGYNAQSYKYKKDQFLTYNDINRIFRDGKVQQNSLGIYGGSGIMKYYVGFDNRHEDGIIPHNSMDRTTFRANLDVIPSEKVLLTVSSGYTLNDVALPDNDNDIFGFLGNTILTYPAYQFTDSASIYGLTTTQKSNRLFGSIQLQYRPFKNFEASAGIGIDDGDMRQNRIYPANLGYAGRPQGAIELWTQRNTQFTYNLDARYSYSIFPELRVTSSVGAQLFDRKRVRFWGEKRDYLTELITNIGAGGTFYDIDETKLHTREAGIFTNHSFSYLDQYFFTLMLRQDYASAIGYDAPNIFYPSVSAAVRLDKYKFFPSIFNLMKVRAAYGESGQLPEVLDGIPLLWEAEPSGFGVGAVLSRIGNSGIEPERIKEFEVGFEAEVFTNYSVEFTYYMQRVKDTIIDFREAPSTGKTASSVPFNIGKVEGWGLESLVQARPIATRNFQLNLSLTNNYQTNEVISIGDAQPIYDGFDINVYKEGLPKHTFYTKKVIGALFKEDGSYDKPELTDERVAFGSPIPTYNGSFTMNFGFLKNFNVYVLTDWATGLYRFNNTKLFAIYIGANNPEYRELREKLGIRDYDDIDITPLEVGSTAYQEAAHRYAKLDHNHDGNFVEEADFFKLREISISYSFKDLLPKIYGKTLINDLVLGVSARNLWTTTKYSGAEVEMNFDGSRSLVRGQDFLTLQQPKVYNMWLRISL